MLHFVMPQREFAEVHVTPTTAAASSSEEDMSQRIVTLGSASRSGGQLTAPDWPTGSTAFSGDR